MNRTLLALIAAAGLILPPHAPAQNAPPAPAAPGAPTAPPAPGSPAADGTGTNRPTRIPTRRPGAPGAPVTPAAAAQQATSAQPQPAAPGTPTLPTLPPAPQAPGSATVVPTPRPAVPAAASAKPVSSLIQFVNAPLEQVLEVYAQMVNRTLLRSPQVPAVQISLRAKNDLNKEEALQALDTVLSLNGIAMIPTGEKFIMVVPSAQASLEGAAFTTKDKKDLPEASQYVTHIQQLEHVKPSEILPSIQPFAKNPTGIVAIDASQVIVLRDFAINVKRMLEVIEKVDVAVPADASLELIPIKYALASDIASVLGSLTSGGAVTTPSSSSRTTGTTGRTTGTTGRTTTGTTGRTTTTGSQFNPQQVNPGGNQPGGTQPGTTGTTAPGARSSFQDRLAQIVRGATGGAGGDQPLLGDARIIPDERTNGILVFANKADMELIKNIIAKLDVVQQQVLIEAIIMEVSLDDTKSLGFSYAQNPTSLGNNKQVFGGMKNVNFLGALTNVNAQSLAQGFSYYGTFGNWEVAMNAIATDTTINVLSRPRIQTSHAVQANLFVGDTVPFINGTTTDINGGSRSTFQNQQVGITLQVLPLINQDGLVVMDITQNVAQLGNPQLIDGNQVPTTVERNATTKVAVKDGDTIILGGFITSTKSRSKSGVPYLKDIPGLGALFRNKTDTNKRVELIVLIRPTVLPTPELASITALAERNKLSAVQRAEAEIQAEEKKLSERNRKLTNKEKKTPETK